MTSLPRIRRVSVLGAALAACTSPARDGSPVASSAVESSTAQPAASESGQSLLPLASDKESSGDSQDVGAWIEHGGESYVPVRFESLRAVTAPSNRVTLDARCVGVYPCSPYVIGAPCPTRTVLEPVSGDSEATFVLEADWLERGATYHLYLRLLPGYEELAAGNGANPKWMELEAYERIH